MYPRQAAELPINLTKHIWNFPLNLGLGNRINDDSPRGVTPWGAYSACVEINPPQDEPRGIQTRPRSSCSPEALFHGAKNFVEVVLLNILSIRI